MIPPGLPLDVDATSTGSVADMERSIQDIARITGTTSRTLRHYDALGMLAPTRTGATGMRYYDDAALLRLQRILLLRGLGLGLAEIRAVLEHRTDEVRALATHLDLLRSEQARLSRQVAAVEHTIRALEEGEHIMAETMFDGFDHSRYEEEVRTRWGDGSWERSDEWWTDMDEQSRTAWKAEVEELNADWRRAAADPATTPTSAGAQDLAARHVAWLSSVPGTPASARGGDLRGYVLGLAEMYVADERFARNWGGRAGAEFVRDALRAHLGGTTEQAGRG